MMSLLAEANHKVGEAECNKNVKTAAVNHYHILSNKISKGKKVVFGIFERDILVSQLSRRT